MAQADQAPPAAAILAPDPYSRGPKPRKPRHNPKRQEERAAAVKAAEAAAAADAAKRARPNSERGEEGAPNPVLKVPPKRARVSNDIGSGGAASPPPTLSLILPGSAIDNAQGADRATALAGALARAAAVFCVDEVIVLDDGERRGPPGAPGPGAALLARILQYQETPQYLRRRLIPVHSDLRAAGTLPPLDAPHHARAGEWVAWREGCVLASARGLGSVVDVGLDVPAILPEALREGARVTVHLGSTRTPAPPPVDAALAPAAPKGGIAGSLAPPRAPALIAGLYWGYITRLAPTLAAAINDGPWGGSYDLRIGTSERGVDAAAAFGGGGGKGGNGTAAATAPAYRHALVGVGGPSGLEAADRDAEALFTHWVNTCPGQGSRTIRTEEAVLISLAALRPALDRGGALGGGFKALG